MSINCQLILKFKIIVFHIHYFLIQPRVVHEWDRYSTPRGRLPGPDLGDQLQKPVQLLRKVIGLGAYESFQENTLKYRLYQKAIENALEDMTATAEFAEDKTRVV
jgi:hypothetical protein